MEGKEEMLLKRVPQHPSLTPTQWKPLLRVSIFILPQGHSRLKLLPDRQHFSKPSIFPSGNRAISPSQDDHRLELNSWWVLGGPASLLADWRWAGLLSQHSLLPKGRQITLQINTALQLCEWVITALCQFPDEACSSSPLKRKGGWRDGWYLRG